MKKRVQKSAKELETAPAPTARSPKRRPTYTTRIYVEGLGQSHAGFLVVNSFSVSSYEPRLVDSVGFLVITLAQLAPTILPPSLPQDSLSSALMFYYGSVQLSPSIAK